MQRDDDLYGKGKEMSLCRLIGRAGNREMITWEYQLAEKNVCRVIGLIWKIFGQSKTELSLQAIMLPCVAENSKSFPILPRIACAFSHNCRDSCQARYKSMNGKN